jgi:hypothetical protein
MSTKNMVRLMPSFSFDVDQSVDGDAPQADPDQSAVSGRGQNDRRSFI